MCVRPTLAAHRLHTLNGARNRRKRNTDPQRTWWVYGLCFVIQVFISLASTQLSQFYLYTRTRRADTCAVNVLHVFFLFNAHKRRYISVRFIHFFFTQSDTLTHSRSPVHTSRLASESIWCVRC